MNDSRFTKRILCTLVLTVPLALAGTASAQSDSDTNADEHVYWTDTNGDPWMSAGGECWYNPALQPEPGARVPGCEPERMAQQTEPAAEIAAFTTETQQRAVRVDSAALFAFDRAELTGDPATAVENALSDLDEGWTVNAVTVRGYTDSIGTEAYNQDLSERRAAAVAERLSRHPALQTARIEAVGLGNADPMVRCEAQQARDALIQCLAPNRRVEVQLELSRQVQVPRTQ